MKEHTADRLIAHFKRKMATTQGRAEGDHAFFVFIRRLAAEQAPADFAALEKEARKKYEAEELDEMRPHFVQRVAEVRAGFATAAVEALDHIPPQDRWPYWLAAIHAHETAFDRLLVANQGAGHC